MRLRPWDCPNTRLDRWATERGELTRRWVVMVWESGRSPPHDRDVPPDFSRNRTSCQRGPAGAARWQGGFLRASLSFAVLVILPERGWPLLQVLGASVLARDWVRLTAVERSHRTPPSARKRVATAFSVRPRPISSLCRPSCPAF